VTTDANVLTTKNTKPTILAVDDDPHITDSFKILLGRDVNLYTANDGRTAFRVLSEPNDINLLVLDITMPEYDAVELLQDLRNSNIILPVIFLSGWDANMLRDISELAKVLGFPVKAVYEKPFDSRKLLEAMIES